MFVGIVAILILLLLLIFVRRPKSGKEVRPVQRRRIPTKPDATYHAVSLKSLPSACDAAKAMEGQRVLSAEAPQIPLPDCDVPTCKCRFVHYKDRRAGDDRRNPWGSGMGAGGTGNYEEEQRKSGERRDDPSDDIF